MIICIDIGNTDIVTGVFKDQDLIALFRTSSDRYKSVDEYQEIFTNLLLSKNISLADIKGCCLSSVVVELTNIVSSSIRRIINKEVVILAPGTKTGLKLKCDNPSEVGADMIADCVGCLSKYGNKSIIVDCGTATKLIVVDENNSFSGCVIMPGVKTSMKSLTSNASLLSPVNLTKPDKVIGKNTPDCLNSGIIYGHACAIEGLIKRCEEELGYKCKIIITGGLGSTIAKALNIDYTIDKTLLLYGLYIIYKKNTEGK